MTKTEVLDNLLGLVQRTVAAKRVEAERREATRRQARKANRDRLVALAELVEGYEDGDSIGELTCREATALCVGEEFAHYEWFDWGGREEDGLAYSPVIGELSEGQRAGYADELRAAAQERWGELDGEALPVEQPRVR
jgi:hypothetical protein